MEHPDLDRRVEELTTQIMHLAGEVKSKTDMPADRVHNIEAEIQRLDGELEGLLGEKRQKLVEDRIGALESRLSEFKPSSKAAAILAGAAGEKATTISVGGYSEKNFLTALADAFKGNPQAWQYLTAVDPNFSGKAVLGTSNATGLSIVPNNFVAELEAIASAGNIYRRIMNVVSGVTGNGVDIPYETDDTYTANISSYGSNKTVVDFNFGEATATLYTIAQIADIGNQLLRQSNGAAEAAARRRLGNSIAKAEATYINNGSGSSQPLGFLQAFLNFGDVAAFKTALSSESRAAALGRGISALESRAVLSDNLAIVMNPTDFWEMATETLGSSGSGGWVFDPATGAAGSAVGTRFQVWGVPVYRDPFWPSAYAGTAVIGAFSEADIYLGADTRIDVSSEANTRWDRNVTGFRIEEDLGFNALPYIATGKFHKVTGL